MSKWDKVTETVCCVCVGMRVCVCARVWVNLFFVLFTLKFRADQSYPSILAPSCEEFKSKREKEKEEKEEEEGQEEKAKAGQKKLFL